MTKKKIEIEFEPLTTDQIRNALKNALSRGDILIPGPGQEVVHMSDGTQRLMTKKEIEEYNARKK